MTLAAPTLTEGSIQAELKPYLAVFASGRRVAGQQFHGWHQASSRPTVDGIDLQPAGDRLLWSENRLDLPQLRAEVQQHRPAEDNHPQCALLK